MRMCCEKRGSAREKKTTNTEWCLRAFDWCYGFVIVGISLRFSIQRFFLRISVFSSFYVRVFSLLLSLSLFFLT